MPDFEERSYELRGRIRYGICDRRIEGAATHKEMEYYRCDSRSWVPESESATALARRLQICLREGRVTTPINRWSGQF